MIPFPSGNMSNNPLLLIMIANSNEVVGNRGDVKGGAGG